MTEIKAVNYTRFIYIAINAIKELYTKVMGHDDRIAKLESENAALKNLVCQDHPKAQICFTN